ncbi:hypothetical protein AALO_G00188930 [Alosa alosa]|uniref:Uncharacterized protein n=1 Tax=Alosa alosa TaxID=278164 RepID=A0AAV6G4S2_9TELE|nr:hypothetical protein AALO_G00188930 [Alosa alosa]
MRRIQSVEKIFLQCKNIRREFQGHVTVPRGPAGQSADQKAVWRTDRAPYCTCSGGFYKETSQKHPACYLEPTVASLRPPCKEMTTWCRIREDGRGGGRTVAPLVNTPKRKQSTPHVGARTLRNTTTRLGVHLCFHGHDSTLSSVCPQHVWCAFCVAWTRCGLAVSRARRLQIPSDPPIVGDARPKPLATNT